MANENTEIGGIVKKCKILLLDIEGTTTSISFVKDKLFPYAEENVKKFLDSEWEKEDVKEAVTALRKLAIEDQEGSVEGVVTIPGEEASKDDQIKGLVSSVKWQMSADRKAGPLKQLQGLIWKQGYDNGDIKGHVYDDVSAALEQWHQAVDQKVYIYSSGSVQAQKLLFGQSLAGDLLKYIDGHFDTAVGAKQEAASYTNIVEKIGCKADEILFLTDIVKEAEAARAAGIRAALVSREGNASLPAEATETFPVIHSLAELTVSNKRKQEPQDELPAKVLKTDVEVDVKTQTDTKASEAETTETTVAKETEKPEKMEVEEESVTTSEATKVESKEEVVVKEITDSSEATGIPIITDVEPVVEIEEKEAKVETKETEKMETESKVPEKSEASAPVAEETPPIIITEIEEISDKQLSDVAEIIDIEPVIEEPTVVEDIEELQSVGEVLEKECDEILSKVQDVTNLDNMPLKPLLNTIAEETMETENVDSNDIVDRILDTELELEMKQCTDIDLNTVAEITDEVKSEVAEENDVKVETSPTESHNVPEVKAAENNVEVKNIPEEKAEESSPMETQEEATVENVPAAEINSKEESVEVKSATVTETTVATQDNDIAEEAKPVADKIKPAADEVKSPVEEAKPAAEDVKTTVVEAESAVEEAKPAVEVKKPSVEETKPAVEETKPAVEEAESVVDDAKAVTDEVNSVVEESKLENDVKETHVNGKTTNGDSKTVALNGDASKNDELSSRLSVENGKEVVNGSNGDSMDAEKGQGDSNVEAEVAEIKVKTVSTEDPQTDPIEQPSEA